MLLILQIMNMRFVITFWLILLPVLVAIVNGLRDVRVTVPEAVRKNDNVQLHCEYNMEGDSLYSVKWYKGRREFYRYTPKENPAMKTFNVNGVNVVRHESNESQVTLKSVQQIAAGKYSCEVSADAPSFHTLIDYGDMDVVEVPEHRPAIHGVRSFYRIGDTLRANCTSKNSKPAANLTWYINDIPVNPSLLKHYRIIRDSYTELESTMLGIQFVVTEHHFRSGKLRVRCVSRIHDIYMTKSERFSELDRPRPSASASNSINAVSPYDQTGSGEGDITDNYMTHIQGDMTSMNAGHQIHTTWIFFHLLTFNLIFNRSFLPLYQS